AVAVLAQAAPNSTAAQREAALEGGTAPTISDSRTSPATVKPRLDICSAIGVLLNTTDCTGGGGAGAATKVAFTTQPAPPPPVQSVVLRSTPIAEQMSSR